MRTQSFFNRTIPQFLGTFIVCMMMDALLWGKTWCSSASHEEESPYIKRKYQVDTWNHLQKLPLRQHHLVEHQIKHTEDQQRTYIWQEGYTGFWNTLTGVEKYMGESSHLNLFLESIQNKSAFDLYKNPPNVIFQDVNLPPEEEALLSGMPLTTIKQNHEGMLKALNDWLVPQENQAHDLPFGKLRSTVEQGIREEAWTLFHLLMSEQGLLDHMRKDYQKYMTKAHALYDLIAKGKKTHDALSKAIQTDDVRRASEQEFNATTSALNIGLRQLECDMENRRLFVNTLKENFRLPDARDTAWTPWNLFVKAHITYSWRDQFMTGTIHPLIKESHVASVYALFEEYVVQSNAGRRQLLFGKRDPVFVPVKNAASALNTNT